MRARGATGQWAAGRWQTAAALVVMCLGAWVMAYPYLFALGGSFKSRSEFTTARSALIPPRLRPSKVIDRYVLRREDADYDVEMKRWPIWRNYVDAIQYGGIDKFIGNSFIYALVITLVGTFFNLLAAYAFARM